MQNADVATVFDQIADLLEVEGGSPFRVRAYRNAARLIGDLPHALGDMIDAGEDLTELPGIGADLAGKIAEIVTTGASATLRELEARTPPALAALLKIPSLGPKRVRALHDQLGVHAVGDLAAAAREGRIRALAGFGEKTERKVLAAIEAHQGEAPRFLRATVEAHANALVAYLRGLPGVRRVALAGSYRRCKETVGDLDVLVTADPDSDVMDRFVAYPGASLGAAEAKRGTARVTAHGPTRAAIVLRQGLQVDVRVVDDQSYGAAMHYFTGSKAHNIAIRRLGQERGLKINEYGVFRGEDRVAGATEPSVFASVGLPYIPPELREDRGEIAAAREGRLPPLVEVNDLRGDLHAHTTASDGHNTLREMADAAQERGYDYLAITDHSPRVAVTRGLTPDRLLRQIDEIDQLNAERPGLTLLKGVEVDILKDGRLDLPDDVLARLDVVVAAIHSAFDLPRDAQTARVLRAMDRPHFSILAHPTGRLINARAPCDLDMEAVIRAARRRGCSLELNAHPERLDLTDVHAQMARDEGVLVAVSSDAHSTLDLHNIRFGIGQARRGWLRAEDVLNTRPLKELRAALGRARA